MDVKISPREVAIILAALNALRREWEWVGSQRVNNLLIEIEVLKAEMLAQVMTTETGRVEILKFMATI